MEIEFKSGIYKITNIVNNKSYIGSAVNVSHRLTTHKYKLRHNTQPNQHLLSAYNKYGFENFKFQVLEYVENKEFLLVREQLWD